jgi:hypothetical protein
MTQGRLDFGTWEQVFYGELDGWQRKRVLVKIIGEQWNLAVVTQGAAYDIAGYQTFSD